MEQNRLPTKKALLDTYERIRPFVHDTPVLTSSAINGLSHCQLYFKCDNFQKAGSYKIRGATNALLQLSEDQKKNGVATHSSGNFAQALSLAAQAQNIPAHIVMPENAPQVKIDAVKSYGGNVILCSSTLQSRTTTLNEVVKKYGATPVHPSNDLDVILGQGTMAIELIREIKDLDFVVVPIGGGGVGAGTCLATHYLSPDTKVVGAEPANADDAFQSLQRGEIVPSDNPDTIADGLRTQLGDKNFPIIRQIIDEIIRVEEDTIISAMRLIWERMKIIVEPSSAVTLAAILTKPEKFEKKKVGLIITGGNVSLDHLPF